MDQIDHLNLEQNIGLKLTTPTVKLSLRLMLKSSLCDYSNAYILVKGTIKVPNTAGAGQPANHNNIEVVFCVQLLTA